ncbi:hypothetical protein [Rahnella sp. ChDrAdgB13]|uniref:hypothetical protein n=1 Tax=Rahnella sp. ChDrAdgB13 TaxID=1850581 RepID=UPI001AD88A35|nr:hypothetical protein [Rahnella sp. ChDrAdgB13]
MNKNRIFATTFIAGCVIPVLILFFLAYSGIDVLRSVFNVIPLVPGGTINSRFLHDSILLNSASVYLGAISGFISALLCIPAIKTKKYGAKDLVYIIIGPALMIILFVTAAILKSPNDLLHANPAFRPMSAWYLSTCIYYSMAIVFFYIFSFCPALMFISLPIKSFIQRKK